MKGETGGKSDEASPQETPAAVQPRLDGQRVESQDRACRFCRPALHVAEQHR